MFLQPAIEEFEKLCPWYGSEVSCGGLYRYFFESRELTTCGIHLNSPNTPLPDSFESILGGQKEYSKRFFSFREFGIDNKPRPTKCVFNDRGLQCDHRLLDLTVTGQLPWQKGSMIIPDHDEYLVDQVSMRIPVMYQYSDDFLSHQAMVIETSFSLENKMIYGFKLLNNVTNDQPDIIVAMDADSAAPNSFLSREHLFGDFSDTTGVLMYVNQQRKITMPHVLNGGLVAVFKGKFYFISDGNIVQVTCQGYDVTCQTSLSETFPDCLYIKQDDRHPRYLCLVGASHVILSIVDLEEMTVFKMPAESEGTVFMPGVVNGMLQCFCFERGFLAEKLEGLKEVEEWQYVSYP